MKIFLIILGIIVIVVISLFLWSVSRVYPELKKDLDTGNDHEFPPIDSGIARFDNFYIFKGFAYFLAKKDEEIRNYLLSRKSRNGNRNADICSGSGDRTPDSKDISPDI